MCANLHFIIYFVPVTLLSYRDKCLDTHHVQKKGVRISFLGNVCYSNMSNSLCISIRYHWQSVQCL